MFNRSKSGFTIVELLIVIVVIGILAAITIVAYNGIQARAQNTTVQSDVRSNALRLHLFKTENDRPATIAELSSNPSVTPKFSTGSSVKLATYCVADSQYAIGGQSKNDQKYYSLNGGAVTNNNSIDVGNVCASLGINKTNGNFADTTVLANNGAFTFTNACASEGSSCSFSGTKTVAYGANGAYVFKSASGGIQCSTNEFGAGDPAPGVVKACYVTS